MISDNSLSQNISNQEPIENNNTNVSTISTNSNEEANNTNLKEFIAPNNSENTTNKEETILSKNEIETNNLDTKTEPQYEEVEIKKEERIIRGDSYFDGKLLELFGWIFLKNFITIFTLDVMSPWGECMMLDYEISHTTLNGKRLQFKGTGGSLFVERFRWIFFTIITLGKYAFWIPVKKTNWILSNIYFEDEGYVRGESYFDGSVLQLVGINILCGFLTIASFGILYPFTECIKLKWIAKHSIINRKKIVFSGNGLNLFGHYILWLFLTIITLGIYGLWLKIKMIQWKVNNSHIKLVGKEVEKDNTIIIMIIVSIALLIVWIIFLINNPLEINLDNFGINGNTNQPINDNYYPNYYDSTYYSSNYYN